MSPDSLVSPPRSRLRGWLSWRGLTLASWRGFALALAGMTLLGWSYRSLEDRRARSASPTGEAAWIWQQRYHRDVSPSAFLAARDFYLESVPARARLVVAADEEYVLTLNNHKVGRGGSPYRGAPDAYEVAPLLLAGGNRLVVELRNGRGPGGFLLRLEDSASRRPLALSDAGWRIFPRWIFGLERGWLPLEEGEKPRIWGVPPIGRWGKLAAPVGKPIGLGFPTPAGAIPIEAGAAKVDGVAPVAVRPLPLSPLPDGTPVPGASVLLDWGRVVTGYLSLELPVPEERELGLLWVGESPPDPYRTRPAGTILVRPGMGVWEDAHPRRFRYALVVGLGDRTSALLTPMVATEATGAAGPTASPKAGDLDFSVAKVEAKRGALGVTPRPSRTPVEDEVWRKLQRLAGIGGREKL